MQFAPHVGLLLLQFLRHQGSLHGLALVRIDGGVLREEFLLRSGQLLLQNALLVFALAKEAGARVALLLQRRQLSINDLLLFLQQLRHFGRPLALHAWRSPRPRTRT